MKSARTMAPSLENEAESILAQIKTRYHNKLNRQVSNENFAPNNGRASWEKGVRDSITSTEILERPAVSARSKDVRLNELIKRS